MLAVVSHDFPHSDRSVRIKFHRMANKFASVTALPLLFDHLAASA